MDLLPSNDELEVVAAAREVVKAVAPLERVRDVAGTERWWLPDLWDAATAQGWFGLAVAEEHGGVGLSVVELVLLFEELGRALVPGPYMATATAALVLAGTEWGAAPMAGQPVALAVDFLGVGARPAVSDGRLQGTVPMVEDPIGNGPLLVDVGGELWWAEGAALVEAPGLDPGRRLARADLTGADGAPTGRSTSAARWISDLLGASLAVGLADGALELALAYATTREQFGRPIGAFQAIKHRLADMALRTERARALVALVAAQARHDQATPADTAAARLLGVEAAAVNGKDAILIHGGMGFTSECPAHLFLRRARHLEFSRPVTPESCTAILGGTPDQVPAMAATSRPAGIVP